MKILSNLLISLIMSAWLVAIAVFSIQNIQQVSLKFLIFESIKLPIGILLAFSVGFGILVGAILPLLWQKPKRRRSLNEDFEY